MKALLKILLSLAILAGLLVGGVLFALNTGPQVDTTWDEQDFQQGLEKSQVKIENIEELNLETLIKEEFSTQGANEVDNQFTSQEMSALVSKANQAGGPIRDVKVSFGDNGEGEVSFKLSENAIDFLKDYHVISPGSALMDQAVNYVANVANNKPVYTSGKLTRTSHDSVNIQLDQLTVGRVPVPNEALHRVGEETERVVNTIITQQNGFHIEELRVDEGRLHYKGTLPSEVEGRR